MRARMCWSMSAPWRLSRSRWIAKDSVGAKPPLALTCTMSSTSAMASSVKAHAGPAERGRPPRTMPRRPCSSIPSNGTPCQMPSRRPDERCGFERFGLVARHHRVGERAIGDAPRHRADRVERERQRKRAVGRHPLLARLPADDAAERRGNAGRAAGVGADRDLAHAVGDRDAAAGGRAARHARAVERIAGRAEMRIGADAGEGELAHVGLGDDHRAGGLEAPTRAHRPWQTTPRPREPASPPASPRPSRRTDP